jgi:hypothetical protein
MIKNYLKVAFRNLLKHKGYAFINILGLAVGIAASVLIFLYITDELSYDRFHIQADRTYRLAADWSNKGDSRIHQLGTPYILAQTIRIGIWFLYLPCFTHILSNFRPLTSLVTYIIEKACGQTQRNREKRCL